MQDFFQERQSKKSLDQEWPFGQLAQVSQFGTVDGGGSAILPAGVPRVWRVQHTRGVCFPALTQMV